MKYIFAAAIIMVASAANAQPVCNSNQKIIDALLKSHMFPVLAGASKDGGAILFKGEDGKWAIVSTGDDMACIQAVGEVSKFAEGI